MTVIGLVLRHWNGDLQDTVFAASVNLLRVDSVGQGDGAIEAAVAAFGATNAAALLLELVFALTLEDEFVAVYLDVDIFGFESGDLGADDVLVVALRDLDCRYPVRCVALPLARAGVRKEAIHLLRHSSHEGERVGGEDVARA